MPPKPSSSTPSLPLGKVRWSALGPAPANIARSFRSAAISIDAQTLAETASFSVLIKPVMNPVLSDYLVALTRITNERLAAEGTDFVAGVRAFVDFAAGRADVLLRARR